MSMTNIDDATLLLQLRDYLRELSEGEEKNKVLIMITNLEGSKK